MRLRMGFGNVTPVVKNLILVNVIVFVFSYLQPGLAGWLALFLPGQPYPGMQYHFEPYQLVTSMFMHAGLGHIFFNMLVLWMLGSAVESYWRPGKFLGFYLVCGLGANLLQLLTQFYMLAHDMPGALDYSLGASGAISGIMVAFGMMFPNEMLMLLFPPVPIKAKYLVTILLLFDVFGGFSGGDNIAHFAHLGGALTGLIITLIWKYTGKLYS